MNGSALLSTNIDGGTHRLIARGSWTAPHAAALERHLDELLPAMDRTQPARIDMGDVVAFDTFGAHALERLRTHYALSAEVAVVGLNARFVGLMDAVRHANEAISASQPKRPRAVNGVAAIGAAILAAGQNAQALLDLLGAASLELLRIVRHPGSLRSTSTVNQLDRVGWQAVPIVLLITFLIGSIIAQQGFFHFRKFGADDYVVDMVGILVLREIGVLIVSIMVAGRSGSSYTAELGSMKMREEIDALRTMGLDPVGVLIVPRLLALVIATPVLTFLGSMAALYGGGLVAWAYGGMSPDIYIARLRDAISLSHFEVGMIKAPFMALVIGIVACSEGLQVKGSAESLGLRTTASVVKSIFLVIVLDGVFAVFFASIGM